MKCIINLDWRTFRMKRVKLPMLLLILLILTGCAPSQAPKPTQIGDGADGSETGASTIPGVASGF